MNIEYASFLSNNNNSKNLTASLQDSVKLQTSTQTFLKAQQE